jgi:hypothetical protein
MHYSWTSRTTQPIRPMNLIQPCLPLLRSAVQAISGNSANIACYAATRAETSHLNQLMGRERAHMAFLDPPYNVRVGDIGSRGQIKHQEFAMASGEMSQSAFTSFLSETLTLAAHASTDGAVHFVCMCDQPSARPWLVNQGC